MATDRGQEFEIKIARAKDLPLSWFDLVLRPEKFQQHLKTLEANPNIEPTGLQLVATFLEKGGTLEGQIPLPVPEGSREGSEEGKEGGGVIEERRQRLVDCALFIASFLHWDIALFEKSLPPAVLYSLLVQLTKHFPLEKSKVPPDEKGTSNLPNEAPPTLTAHVLYCHWVLRFLTLSHLPPEVKLSTNVWDITCASSEQIKSLLEPQLSYCVGFLEEVCRYCHCYCIPSVAVSLPMLGRHERDDETVELSMPASGRDLTLSEMLCQLYYSLGCHYFWQEDFKRALSRFKKSVDLLASLETCPSLVDAAQMKGFMLACRMVQAKMKKKREDKKARKGTRKGAEEELEATISWDTDEEDKEKEEEGEGEEEEEEGDDEEMEEEGQRVEVEEEVKERTVLEQLEHCRISDPEGVVDLLIQDLQSLSLPLTTCLGLQKELAQVANDTSSEPHSKRAKLGSKSSFASIPVHSQVCVCNSVKAVVDGQPVQPAFWRLLSSFEPKSSLYQFLFHVCHRALPQTDCEAHGKDTRTIRLQSFVSVCCRSPEPHKVWDILSQSQAKSLATEEDAEVVRRLSPPEKTPCDPASTSLSSFSPFSSLPSAFHERQILCATHCQGLLSSVDTCFKAVPASEHKSLALKWVGSGDEFITFDLISDPILLTKYNAMVHKAHQLKRAKCYTESVRFLRAALGLIPRPSAQQKSSGSHPKPDQVLLDQILWVELKGAALEARTLLAHEVGNRFSGLIEKAKSFCQRNYTLHPDRFDALTVSLASAFLLNTHSYQQLATLDHPFIPGKVAPRLAIAAINMKEDRDARKSIRDLFGAVLSVFSTPVVSGTDTRSEVEHKQLQLRSQFDVLVENLEDPTSLSLLLMALVRIWSILKKPEEEIILQSEHIAHWPTVIGSPGSVNVDHVFRALSSTLHHSLSTHPYNETWIILQAEVHYATGRYGVSLLNYLKAGAVTSRHFEDEVPSSVWSAQVYRKIITCCTQLNFHTHAVLFCQLLVPVDYELAFSILSSHSSSMVESYFTYFWDMVIIEYLIYINAKRGDKYKQAVAVQIAGQPELNCNNSEEVLCRAAQVRRRKLLQSFYEQSFSTL